MVTRLVIALGALLLASPAHATIYWASGFELCYPQATASPTFDSNYFSGVGGNPLVTSAQPFTSGYGINRCSARFTPASGATQYWALNQGISGGVTSLNLSCKLKVTTAGTSGLREIAAFGNAGGGHFTKGMILALVPGSRLLGVQYYGLSVYYGSLTQKVCSGSTAADRICSTLTECPAANDPNEPQCSVIPIASSPQIAEGTEVAFTLTQTNGSGSTAGQVTGGLYQGAAGSAYNRGSIMRTVGYCAGGSNSGNPCNVSGDCPSSTCTTTDVGSITSIYLGSSDTGSGARDFQLDDCVLYSGAAMPNTYIEGLDLAGSSIAAASTNWGSVGSAHSCADGTALWNCGKDTSSPDGASSAIENSSSSASKPTANFTFATPAIPSVSPTPKAVVIEAVAQDKSGSGYTIQFLPQYAGTVTPATTPAPFDPTSFAGSGGLSDPYYQAPPSLWERAWTYAELAGVNLNLRKSSGGSGDTPRVSSIVAEVVYQMANPSVPTTIPDRDQDGEITACFVGDSTWDNIDFQNAIVANLTQPTNIYFYTRGGSRIWDAGAEWTQLLEGTSGTFLGLTVRRGAIGRTCDVVVISHFTNSWVLGSSVADPKNPTTYSGVPQAGYCEDNGGSNQGNACYCAGTFPGLTSNYSATPAVNVTPGAKYCVNTGDFKSTCGNNYDCGCASNAGCATGRRTPGPLHTPSACQTNSLAGCTSAACCIFSGFGDPSATALSASRIDMCAPGCLNAAGCSSGVCMRGPTMADRKSALENLQAATDARPTPAATPPVGGKPVIVYVAPPPAAINGLGSWPSVFPLANRTRDEIVRWAKATGRPYIDMFKQFELNASLYRQCATSNGCTDDENVSLCFRDGVHWTIKCQQLAANVVAAALTNTPTTHDGVCTSSVCSAGRIGDPCSGGADCDTWSLDFGAQP